MPRHTCRRQSSSLAQSDTHPADGVSFFAPNRLTDSLGGGAERTGGYTIFNFILSFPSSATFHACTALTPNLVFDEAPCDACGVPSPFGLPDPLHRRGRPLESTKQCFFIRGGPLHAKCGHLKACAGRTHSTAADDRCHLGLLFCRALVCVPPPSLRGVVILDFSAMSFSTFRTLSR